MHVVGIFPKIVVSLLIFLAIFSFVRSFSGNKRRQFHEHKFSRFGEIAKSLHFADINFFRLKNFLGHKLSQTTVPKVPSFPSIHFYETVSI